MSISGHFVRTQEFVTRQIAGETLVIPIKGGIGDLNSIYTLNQTGTLIWESLSAGAPVADIVEAVCREYDVAEEEAARDVAEFLASLEAEDLAHRSQRSGG